MALPSLPNLPVVYQPVVHTHTDRQGRTLHSETLTAVAPVLAGPGQLIDHFRLTTSKSLALLRGGGLGDLLMLSPVLQRLHADYPRLRITLFCEPQFVPLLDALEWLEVLPRDDYLGCQYQYDAQVDLNYYVERSMLRTEVDRVSLFGAAFGFVMKQGRPLYRVHTEETEWAQGWLDANGVLPGPLVGLAPWATDPRRTWKLDHARDLCRKVAEAGGTTLVFHHSPLIAESFPESERVRVVAGLEIRQVAALLQLCDAVVSVDTGIYHLAGAVQQEARPYLVLVWGMWEPRLRTRWLSNYLAVTPGPEVECFPCNEAVPPSGCRWQCMDISAERVWNEALAPLCGDVRQP